MDATAVLLANLAEIYDQLRSLRDTAGLTADETRAVDELLAEIDQLPSDRLANIDDIDYLASAASRLKLTLEARAASRPTDEPS
jgi:hemerythrin superfamily protein